MNDNLDPKTLSGDERLEIVKEAFAIAGIDKFIFAAIDKEDNQLAFGVHGANTLEAIGMATILLEHMKD